MGSLSASASPASGNEKGNVENKVGYVRRNFFVPIPQVEDLQARNGKLLTEVESDFEHKHYKKPGTIRELFDRDKKVLADGYGKFCLDGRHWYATAPELAGKSLVAGIGAHTVTVYNVSRTIECVHRRVYGSSRSDTSNYKTSLEALLRKPGAWKNSDLRHAMNPSGRDYLDALDKAERMRILTTLSKVSEDLSFLAAQVSLADATRLGKTDDYSLQAPANRAAYEEMGAGQTSGHDLSSCDREFIHSKGVPL